MGFEWAHVPERLARDLARELVLEGSPAEALSEVFGATPDADFVRVAWTVLRDRWLADDGDARADVVAGLRAAGLGAAETVPRGVAAQREYLRTCRNTARLRDTVLERFLELGDPAHTAHPHRPPVPPPDDDPATVDLAAKVESSWRELSTALAEVLGDLELGVQLTLTLDPTAGGTGDATYYVEFVVPEEGELHAEAVGNAALPAAQRLDRHAIADLVALGWSPPGVVEGTEGNFGLRVPAGDAERLAAITVRTLREVFGTPHPAFLTYAASGVEGEPHLPPLGAARRVGAGEVKAVDGADDPKAPLDTRVRTVVARLLERAPEELPVDADGDIAIRSGSAMVFVRVNDDPPLVDVFSPVLTEVRPTERLYERLSSLTRTMPIGRLYLEDATVWASVGVFGTEFQAVHLSMALRVMTGLADTLDDRLQGDFGGKIFFGDALPERREHAAPPERTGMYL